MHSRSVSPPAAATAADPLRDEVSGDGEVERTMPIGASESPGTTAVIPADPDLEPGFPADAFSYGGSFFGGQGVSVTVGNIDADPTLEIVASSLAAGPLWAWDADGSLVPGWPSPEPGGVGLSAMGNLSTSAPGYEIIASGSRQVALDGSGGVLPGWPEVVGNYTRGAPVAADLDGDGVDEVVLNEGLYDLEAYRADGTRFASYRLLAAAGNQVSPAIADLTGDGDPEVIAASGGFLTAYDAGGAEIDGFPIPITTATATTEVYPVVGDVDGDGDPEIVVAQKVGNQTALVVVSHDAEIQWQVMLPRISYSTAAALADLDGDDVPEILVQTEQAVHAYHGNGTPVDGWPATWGTTDSHWLSFSSPVVGDVDGDQLPDVLVTSQLAGTTSSEIYLFHADGTLHDGFPKNPPIGGIPAMPAIADIDLDGRNELIVAGEDSPFVGYHPFLWAYDLGGPTHGPIEWGQFGGGPQHLGTYGQTTSPRSEPPATEAEGDVPLPALCDLAPGPAGSNPNQMTPFGDGFALRAWTAAAGDEPWISDGTCAGTALLSDVRSGSAGSSPRELTAAGDQLFFVANDGTSGAELWVSDGSDAGTHLVTDIAVGGGSSNPRELTAVGSTVYFAATDGVTGYELWRSDGSEAGTSMVADLLGPGTSGSDPRLLMEYQGDLVFTATRIVEGVARVGFWRTDGTEAGTELLTEETIAFFPWFPGEIVQNVAPVAFLSNGVDLMELDGADASWVTPPPFDDPTPDPMLRELVASEGGFPLHFSMLNRPWRYRESIVAMRDAPADPRDAGPGDITPSGDEIGFVDRSPNIGYEMWYSPGNPTYTGPITDFRPGPTGSGPRILHSRLDSQWFLVSASDGVRGHELWRVNGNGRLAAVLFDLAGGSASAAPGIPALVGGTFAFAADDVAHGRELRLFPESSLDLPIFLDIGDSSFRDHIRWLAWEGITQGCEVEFFCPTEPVTRGQMATFLVRAFDLPPATGDHFVDDSRSTHQDSINRLAESGITNGCRPDRFCPDRAVTRGEMASFLARALDLPAATADYFADDDGTVHEDNINRMREAELAFGCQFQQFCPAEPTTREQMAAFLHRALESLE